MNFLSHYYFNRYSQDPEQVLGSVLPDLLRNADGAQRIHPGRFELEFLGHPRLQALHAGWMHHVETDRKFHNLPFFYLHTHELRLQLAPLLEHLPIRASFLSHIALELILDHLLLKEQAVDVNRFYQLLGATDKSSVDRFLLICGWEETEKFHQFFEHFLNARYLERYLQLHQVVHALGEICMRVWSFPMADLPKGQAAEVLQAYINQALSANYMQAFDEIDNFV